MGVFVLWWHRVYMPGRWYSYNSRSVAVGKSKKVKKVVGQDVMEDL